MHSASVNHTGRFLFAVLVSLFGALACAHVAPGDELTIHQDYQGFWIRSSSAEAFVAIKPVFRILSLRTAGGVSLLADSTTAQQGVRLAFMEGEQVPKSFDVGNVPAEVVARSSDSASLHLASTGGLEYRVKLQLQPNRPVLEMQTVLQNVGDTDRRVGCWTVLAFARDGTIVAPFRDKPRLRRRLVLSWWSAWPQPAVAFGRDALVVDADGRVEGDAFKIGLITEAGWAGFVRGSQALLAHASFDAQGIYPEDGANVVVFMGGAGVDGGDGWCETELVGPMVMLKQGDSVVMNQTLELLSLPAGDRSSPDAWRIAVEQARADPEQQLHSGDKSEP